MPLNTKQQTILFALLAIAFLGVGFVLGKSFAGSQISPESQTTQAAPIELAEFRLQFETDPNSDSSKSEIKVLAPVNVNGFDLLKLAAAQNKVTLDDYNESDLGVFIKSLNGVANDSTAGKYWIYYVNDKMAKVTCKSYLVERGDVIRWTYQDSPY